MGKEGKEVDETGRVIKETWYLDDGKYQITEFDYEGNVTKSTTYDKESNVEGWQEFEYDDDNNMIKMFDYEADGSYKVTEKYPTGTIKRMIVYESDGGSWERTYSAGFNYRTKKVNAKVYACESNVRNTGVDVKILVC